MAFTISSVTNAGRQAMQLALDEGYAMTFTAIRSGNGIYSENEDVFEMTALKSQKNSYAIGSREEKESC